MLTAWWAWLVLKRLQIKISHPGRTRPKICLSFLNVVAVPKDGGRHLSCVHPPPSVCIPVIFTCIPVHSGDLHLYSGVYTDRPKLTTKAQTDPKLTHPNPKLIDQKSGGRIRVPSVEHYRSVLVRPSAIRFDPVRC